MSGIAARMLAASWDVPIVEMFHTLGLMKNRIARSPEEMEGAYRINGEADVIQAADRIIAATQPNNLNLSSCTRCPHQKSPSFRQV